MTSSPRPRPSVLASLTLLLSLPALVLSTGLATADTDSTSPPPNDVVGRSTSSNVLRVDDLAVSATGSDGMTSSQWRTPKSDLTGYSSQGQVAPTVSRRALTFPNLTSRSARLIDSGSDRVLSMQRTAAGDGALLQLSSPNGAMEAADWASKNTVKPQTVEAGQTYAFKARSGYLTGATDSGDLHNQLSVASSDDQLTMAQQWTLRSASDGTYRLVNRSDGLCLNVLDGKTSEGSPVGAWPCPDSSSGDNEEWTISDPGTDTAQLLNKRSGRYLAVSDTGKLELGGLANDGQQSDQLWTLTRIYDPVAPVPTWSTSVSSQPGMPAAMATGDLDRSVGRTEQYGDEAVVAYIDDDHQLNVRVIDYNANDDHFLASTPTASLPDVGTTIGGTWYPGSVGVAIGNFTGETTETVTDPDNPDVTRTELVRNNQVAVTWQDDKGLHASFLSYSATEDGGRQLSVEESDVALPRSSSSVSSKPTLNALAGMSDTMAGDFDGDDTDDLAVSYAAADSVDSGTGAYSGTTAWLKIANVKSDLTVNTNADQQFDGRALAQPSAGSSYTRRGVSLTAGLFDLGADENIRHRQVAASWTDTRPSIRVQLADLRSGAVHLYGDNGESVGGDNDPTDHPVSLAAGGFRGLGSGSAFPTWYLALGTKDCVLLYEPDQSGTMQSEYNDCNYSSDMSVAAFDRSGRSLLLGAPAVLTVDQLVKPVLIAAQPPTHADWLIDPSTGAGRFFNISRNSEFIVDMGQSTDTTTSTTHTKKSSTTLGISEASDAKTTVKGGLGNLESASETIDIGQKFDKESETDKENTTQYQHSQSVETSQTTGSDDVVNAFTETDTIYRYPILSGPLTGTDGKPYTNTDWCPTTCYGFYEVTLPGEAIKTEGEGKGNAWYQPDWQNGNALSYPPLGNGDLTLTDKGSYTYPDPDNGGKPKSIDGLIADSGVIQIGGAKLSQTMMIKDGADIDATRTSSGSMTNSGEAKSSTKLHGSIGVASASEEINISAGVQKESTWANTQTSTNDITSSSVFKIDAPEYTSAQAYNVQTKYYVDTAGTPKVVHGVDLTTNSSGKTWWKNNYSKPDLALNLNDAVTMTLNDKDVRNVPVWTADDSRQEIRGFYALQPDDPNSPATSGQPYANNPAPGDSVRFAVRLHNYSVGGQAPASTAQFYAVPMEADGATIAGKPEPIGGTVSTPPLAPQEVQTVTSNPWTAVGPSDGPGSQAWRIFVVVDPDGTIDETHPWKGGPACPESSIDHDEGYDVTALTDPMTGQPETLACGQNNQGYGQITVTAPSGQQAVEAATARLRSAAPQTLAARQQGVERQAASREDEDYLTLDRTTLFTSQNAPVPARRGVQQVVVEQSVRGLVQASSTIHSGEQQNVLVWDGEPGKGELIAHTYMAGADADDGGVASFTWMPAKPGRHVLTSVLLTTNGPDKVKKTVVNVKAHGRPTGLALSPGQTTIAPNVPVRFTASTVDAQGNRINDVTRTTRLTIQPDGSCRRNLCSATIAGEHTVMAQHAGLSATATITVAKASTTILPGAPKVSGTARVGSRLTAVSGTWQPAPVALSYQWLRNNVAISRATGSSYVLTPADYGKRISVKVTGSKPGYNSAAKTSAPTPAVAAGILSARTPTISGKAKVKKTLTARVSAWGPAPVRLSYQWVRNGRAISGATRTTYKLVKKDRKKRIAVKVTGSKTGYTTTARTSAQTVRIK